MIGRAIITVGLALIAAWFVVRVAFVDAYAVRQPATAATLWAGHPAVVLTAGLEEVGEASLAGRTVDKALIRRLLAASAKAPLAPEPFLVRGVEQQLASQERVAARAFLEARRRDPRSLAARYFLADHYLRTGQTRLGLGEISALTRLVPQSLERIGPQLAAYARIPGAAADVKAMLRQQPQLEPLLLNALAADARDSRLALALWSGRSEEVDRGWQQRLVTTLADAGRFDEAYQAWLRFNPAAPRRDELVDPEFTAEATPPFGWILASGPSGVAEPEGGGRLHILYYGRDDMVLAGQLLMLKPGSYRLSMRIAGTSPTAKALAWRIQCLPDKRQLAKASVGSARAGVLVMDFIVPGGCGAQNLELEGVAPDLPEQADFSISQLSLRRSGR